MADRVNIRKNMELKELATLSEIEMEEKENLMFPADELYGSNWENRWLIRFGECEGQFSGFVCDRLFLLCLSYRH